MAYMELPTAAGMPHQSFSVTLDGSVYRLWLRYNTRAGHWALELSDAGANPLLSGIAIRLGVDLLAPYAGDNLPAGKLFAMNWVDPYSEPDRDNFGTDVSLVYEEA